MLPVDLIIFGVRIYSESIVHDSGFISMASLLLLGFFSDFRSFKVLNVLIYAP